MMTLCVSMGSLGRMMQDGLMQDGSNSGRQEPTYVRHKETRGWIVLADAETMPGFPQV